jgi:prolyl-tRNA synthetase
MSKISDQEKGENSFYITPRSEDYSQWYLDIIKVAELAEYGPAKGSMVIKPYGYAIWERIQKVLDEKFKQTGVENAYFPLLIPERLLKKEADHVEGFAPEVAVVTHAGGKELEERLVIRPTSETIMYEVFSGWIHSYRDLPLLINQWANVVRWEMRTRLFLRTTEFLWQEGHTVHKDEKDADDRARIMLEVYRDFSENYMAIPVILGQKTESEKFAGALKTYSCEAMMQDGKALQFATSHNLGDHFAKAFDIKYLDENNELKFGWQTSWGLSTRSIGGLIMTHSDDKGLVLPPKMASVQVVIVPIINGKEKDEDVLRMAGILSDTLKDSRILTKIDSRDLRPGEKFYEWERKGVPLRIEIGPRDLEKMECVVVDRISGEKKIFSIENIDKFVEDINGTLETIQINLFNRALEFQKQKTKVVDSWDDFVKEIEADNFVLAHWDGEAETEKKIKDETGATIRCISFERETESGACIKTGNPSEGRVIFAKAY